MYTISVKLGGIKRGNYAQIKKANAALFIFNYHFNFLPLHYHIVVL